MDDDVLMPQAIFLQLFSMDSDGGGGYWVRGGMCR